MGILKSIIDLIKPGPKQSLAVIEIAYQAALKSGNTHEEAILDATRFRFNFRGPAGLLFGQEFSDEMIVELLKAVDVFDDINKVATFVAAIEEYRKYSSIDFGEYLNRLGHLREESVFFDPSLAKSTWDKKCRYFLTGER
jgi:hypothetical protein